MLYSRFSFINLPSGKQAHTRKNSEQRGGFHISHPVWRDFKKGVTTNHFDEAVRWGAIEDCVLLRTILRFECDKLLYLLRRRQGCKVST